MTDTLIARFLAVGGYPSIDEWMADSDFVPGPDGSWLHEEGHPVDPEGTIMGAIEACGFE